MTSTPRRSSEDLRREAQEILDEQVRKIEAAGGSVAIAHLRMNERRDEAIVHLAEEIGADLIVMGSRGFGGLRRALLGNVADSVVRHAHCPVLVVRPTHGVDSRFMPQPSVLVPCRQGPGLQPWPLPSGPRRALRRLS